MTKNEALKLALEALEYILPDTPDQRMKKDKAITALRQALEKPADEPVATLWQHGETGRTRVTMPGDITDCDARWFKASDLYTRPQPAAQWVGLTDEEMRELEKQFNAERVRTSDEEYLIIYPGDYWQWQRAIEAKLKEKNT